MIIVSERWGREILETLILILFLLHVYFYFSSALCYVSNMFLLPALLIYSQDYYCLFNLVSSHDSRCFLIWDICTLSDVRVRALCCELSGALDSAPSSSSVSQVASDMPECEWRGTRHTPPLQMNWNTRSLNFWHEEPQTLNEYTAVTRNLCFVFRPFVFA